MSPRFFAPFVLLNFAALTLLPAAAAESTSRQVEKLFETGWKRSADALAVAQEQYQAASGRSDNPWLHYAFALVNVKNYRYADAVAALDKTLNADEKHLPAREAKIWLLIQLKRRDAAVVEMEQQAEAIAALKEDQGKADELSEHARFLGRAFGFLSGPAEGDVDDVRLDEARRSMLSALGESFAKEFVAGAAEVEKQFTELFLEREEEKADAKATEEKIKKRLAEDIERDKEAVAGQKEEIDRIAVKLREEVDANLSEIDKNIDPLERELGVLNARGADVRFRIADVDRSISRALGLADSTEDPVLRARYLADADRLTILVRQYQREYAVLDAAARGVKTKLASLLGQRNAAIGRYEAEMKRLGREASNLRRKVRRIAADEKSVAKPASGVTGRSRSLLKKARSFTTYQDFPLEREKQRVLEAVKE